MNIAQIKRDLDSGVMVCSATWRELVEWAVKMEAIPGCVPIETWQERMGKSGKRECADLAVELAQAEIDDLRSALTVAEHRAWCAEVNEDGAREHLAELLAAAGKKEE